MPHYKLICFKYRGLCEPIRYLLAYAGVQYDEETVPIEDWPLIKSTTPMGQLPVLEVDGVQICQARAICRYLARAHGLAGSDLLDQAKADMLIDGLFDVYNGLRPVVSAKFVNDDDTLGEAWQSFKCETLDPFLEKYTKFLSDVWFIGKQITWVDLAVAEFLDRLEVCFDNSVLDAHEKLAKHVRNVHSLPSIKKYVEHRPDYFC